MFKVGDVVEITEESDATGMLDFKKGEGYSVLDWRHEFSLEGSGALYLEDIKLKDESGRVGWYSSGHFKLKAKEEEKVETLFKKGQVVWDIVNGKGVVENYYHYNQPYPVKVVFEDGDYNFYTDEGKLEVEDKSRRLFFSEPKIEAATEPMFQPVLKEGDKLLTVGYDWQWELHEVAEELEYAVKNKQGTLFYKNAFAFYRLGEKIVFN